MELGTINSSNVLFIMNEWTKQLFYIPVQIKGMIELMKYLYFHIFFDVTSGITTADTLSRGGYDSDNEKNMPDLAYEDEKGIPSSA